MARAAVTSSVALMAFASGFSANAQTTPSVVLEPTCNISYFGTFGSLAADAKAGRKLNIPANSMVDNDLYAALRTNKIPMQIGTLFGVIRQIANIKDETNLQLVISHPQMINDKGQSSTKTMVQSKITNMGDMYRFDLPYALVPGNWSFDYFYRGKSLCKQDFEIR